MEIFGVVYLVQCKVNGKRYVGQTIKTVEERFNEHAKCKKNMLISKAIQKYGKENFRYGVIKSCASKAEMDYWEKYFIVALKSKVPYGYNLTDGGEGTSGIERTPEYRAKLSARFSGEKNPRYGKKNTPEHTAKIVAANLGKKRSAETCTLIAESQRGKVFTKERCANISAALRGKSPYKNLIAELDARQLSYTAFAKLLNSSEGNVSRKMTGVRNFTERDKIKLVEIFKKPIEYLLARDDGKSFWRSLHGYTPFKNLATELDKLCLSYTALAKLLGLETSAVSRKMRGKNNFTERDKIKLVEIFGKPIEYLLARDDA